jgi:hypothetical protein
MYFLGRTVAGASLAGFGDVSGFVELARNSRFLHSASHSFQEWDVPVGMTSLNEK